MIRLASGKAYSADSENVFLRQLLEEGREPDVFEVWSYTHGEDVPRTSDVRMLVIVCVCLLVTALAMIIKSVYMPQLKVAYFIVPSFILSVAVILRTREKSGCE